MKDAIITPKLSRCGRILLDWQQSDLAVQAGLSVTAIKAFEQGAEKTRVKTVLAIQSAFEKNGIEFLPSGGVRRVDELASITRLTGADFMARFYDDIYQGCALFQSELLASSADQNIWHRPPYTKINVEFSAWLERTGTVMRSLIRKGDPVLDAPTALYRTAPQDMLGKINYCTYGDRLAFVLPQKKQVIIIRNVSIVDTFKRQFEYLWRVGKSVSK